MLVENILARANAHPDRLAAVQDGARLSWRQFAGRIVATRAFLLQNGLAPRTGMAVVCSHRLLESWILGLALRSLGLDTIYASDAAGLQKLQLSAIASIATMASEPRPGLRQLAQAQGIAMFRVPEWRDMDLPAMASQEVRLADIAEGGHVMLTSGTTGRHKKVLRDAAREASLLPLHARINGIDADSLVYAWNFGQWTAGGYRWPLLAWSMGGAVVFSQQGAGHLPLREFPFTHMFATPQMLADLLGHAGAELPRCDSVRLFVTGGEMDRELARTVRERLAPRLYSVLASTEALTVAITPIESDEDLYWHRILPEREVQVVDEAGRPLPTGIRGRVRVRILDGLAGYLDDEAASREFFDGDWFYPGDLGLFDETGRLNLQGRSSDVVNVQGNKIATAAMERALRERLGAEGVCILSLHHGAGDEQLHVAIESRLPVTHEQCRAAMMAELRPLRAMHLHFDLLPRLPRNAMGKVSREELRRQLQSGKRRPVA